jgi:hypothetical protein
MKMNNLDKKYIRTQEEFDRFGDDVRNRQHISNPILVNFINADLSDSTLYNWDKEYLEITRIDNVDNVKRLFYKDEQPR